MSLERQKESVDQKTTQSHEASGEDGIRASAIEVSQRFAEQEQKRALTNQLMEKVCERTNLNQAYRRVKSNQGGAGVDGMKVDDLYAWIGQHKEELIRSLLEDRYKPKPVRGVIIPKPGGGVRQLGIPTVVDRLIQQALSQVLEPIFDPMFSNSSYGFRPGRSAHQALKEAQRYVADGHRVVVDVDLERFFDRVNHDILMSRLARWIGDKRVLRLIRRYLQAGLMREGVCERREEGTPQGGPLSPLLSNILLDEFDKELEKRGHKFCRYADDCNIYVRSRQAGERVMESIERFLEKRLRLKINRKKSSVSHVGKRKFLGHLLLMNGRLGIAPGSLKRAKKEIKEITRRCRSQRIESVILELNQFLSGWVTYFRYSDCRNHLEKMDSWIKRKLRCYRLKQRKRAGPIAEFLQERGVPEWRSWILAGSGKGWWRLSGSPSVQEAMNDQWFRDRGLLSLSAKFGLLNLC